MDWLRRNWPDLLIGVALIAVIAGIIATLISGGTIFPSGGGSRSADLPTQTPPAVTGTVPSGQGAAVAEPPGTTQTTGQAGDAPVVTVGGDQTPGSQAGTSQDAAGSTTGQGSTSGSIAVLPPDGGQATSTLTTTPQTSGQSTATQQTAGTQSATTTVVTPAATSVTPSASADAPYRVSVGAYGNADNARRQLDTFMAAGYPAFLGTQGNLTIVLVGPYDTESEARGVAQRIRQATELGVSDPTVYLLESDDQADTSAATATPAAGTGQPAASTATATTSTATQAPAATGTVTSGDRYLQVGAYGSRDSSLPQRERLEGMGFVVSERLESGLVKLLIGPFDATGLAGAQARLQAAGIDSFPR